MNFESNLFQITFAVVAMTAIIVSYRTFQPQTDSGGHATSTEPVLAASCNKYQSNASEFRPSYRPTFDNRQALKQAMIRYHGEDMKGKDGPMAAVGFDVALIYHEYRSYKCNNGGSENFKPESLTDAGLSSINEDSIGLSLSAVNDGAELKEDLAGLGATDITRYQHVVSATIPIKNIPEIAKLSSLRSARISRTTTNSAGGAITD